MASRLLIAGALAALLAPVPAGAASGPCRDDGTGPTCQYWTGTVVTVDDGDTVHVDLDGDGSHRLETVRLIGIQAMEQSVYSHDPSKRRGECHALEATARLESIIKAARGRVRIAAQDPNSRANVGGRQRLRRSLATRVNGRWRDVGRRMMAGGYTIWLEGVIETAWNRTYDLLGQRAALKHLRMFDPTYCGVGPSQDVPLRVWAQWDPPGADVAALDDEWVKIFNPSATAVDLSGWWERDSMLRRFTFPPGTVLPGGGTITLHTGQGTNTATDFYWGLATPMFENPDARDIGDGAYLFDPQGDLRAWMLYPCLVGCSDPNAGAVELAPHPKRPESVALRNVSDHPVDLYGYALATPGSMYPLPESAVIAPGRTYVFDDFGADYRLPDPGGEVSLKTFSDITLACASWGSGSCQS